MNTTDGVYEGLAAGDLAEAKPTTGNDAQKATIMKMLRLF